MIELFAQASTGVEFNVAQNIAWAIIAAIMLFSSFKVVTTGNVVHAALYLVIVLAGAAGLFILLGSDFVGATQILVYICLLYTSPSPRDKRQSRMPSSA